LLTIALAAVQLGSVEAQVVSQPLTGSCTTTPSHAASTPHAPHERSAQVVAVAWQLEVLVQNSWPEAHWQVPPEQTLPPLQVTAVPVQAPFAQWSLVVHALPSSQAAVVLVCTQAPRPSQ
jgi:hypothetical protein